jgi:hypothetical protein
LYVNEEAVVMQNVLEKLLVPGIELLLADWLHPLVHCPETKSGPAQNSINEQQKKLRHAVIAIFIFALVTLPGVVEYRYAFFVAYRENTFFIV